MSSHSIIQQHISVSAKWPAKPFLQQRWLSNSTGGEPFCCHLHVLPMLEWVTFRYYSFPHHQNRLILQPMALTKALAKIWSWCWICWSLPPRGWVKCKVPVSLCWRLYDRGSNKDSCPSNEDDDTNKPPASWRLWFELWIVLTTIWLTGIKCGADSQDEWVLTPSAVLCFIAN